MNYFDLVSALEKNRLFVFSLRDVDNLFPEEKLKTVKNGLSRWTVSGRFRKIRRNLYEFVKPGMESGIPDLYVANKIYAPSYISLETALSVYDLIPDIAAQVTSMTTLTTRRFTNSHGSFIYRSCRKRVFTGYKLMRYEGCKILIADREKALADFVYFSIRRVESLNYDEERFNKMILKKLNWTKVLRYAGLFNEKTVRALKNLKSWGKC